MGQDCLSEFLGRTNRFAVSLEACLELLRKLLEQLNVLRLFARELQERARAIVVFIQVRSYVVEHERQNELLDHTEGVEIAVATNLIETKERRKYRCNVFGDRFSLPQKSKDENSNSHY